MRPPTTDETSRAAQPQPWSLWPALGLYGVGWLALALPWLSGAVTIPWDAKAHFYPQLQFLAQSLHRGENPFWTPFLFSGHPQIADPQSLIFSPYLLLAWFDANPSFRQADGVAFVMLGLGGCGLILLFRDRGWHLVGALVAAFAFAFGASAAWRIQHLGQVMSLAYWPVALWLVTRAIERGSLLAGFGAGAVAGLMGLGRDQVAFLGLWLLAAYVVWSWTEVSSRAVRRSLAPLTLAAAVGALIVAGPLVLTALLSAASNRPAITLAGAEQGSLHPALLLTVFIPNLFGADGPFLDYWGPPSPRWGPVDLFFARNMGVLYLGALPVVLIFLAALRGMLWAREIRFFTVAAAVMLAYALGRYTPVFPILFNLLPGVDLFRRPGDATFLLGAVAALLAGYAAHRGASGTWRHAAPRRWGIEAFVLGLPFAIGMALAVAKGTLMTAAWPLATAALFLAAAIGLVVGLPRLPQRGIAGACLAFLALDLAWNNGPNESTALPPETYDALRPHSASPLLATLKERLSVPETRLDRVELTGLGFHWPNASLVHQLHNVLGYNPVRLSLYTAATGADDHAALPEQRRFSPLFPSYRSTLADLLGLRFIATGVPIERIDPTLAPGDLIPLGSLVEGYVYENPRAMPRAFFATGAQKADFATMVRTGAWPPADLARTVLLEDAPSEASVALPAAGSARIAGYRNTEVIIDVEATAPGYLVLNDPYHPWWFAEVNGKEAPVLRANVLFRAVALPAGRHQVRFVFRPLAGAWRELKERWR